MAVLMSDVAFPSINRCSRNSIVKRLSHAALTLDGIGRRGLAWHSIGGWGCCVLDMMLRISKWCTHIVRCYHVVLLLLLGHNATFIELWNILGLMRRKVHFTMSIMGPSMRGCLVFMLKWALNRWMVVTCSTVRIRLRMNLITVFTLTEKFFLGLNHASPIYRIVMLLNVSYICKRQSCIFMPKYKKIKMFIRFSKMDNVLLTTWNWGHICSWLINACLYAIIVPALAHFRIHGLAIFAVFHIHTGRGTTSNGVCYPNGAFACHVVALM